MGAKPDQVTNNFTNGEISPKALGRFDLSKYANSAEVVENFILYQLGGGMFRPGTRYVATTKTVSHRSRLLKFFYSTTQSYAIEAGNLYFRYYTDGGQLTTSDPYTNLLIEPSGSNGSTTFTDISGSAHGTGTVTGGVVLATVSGKKYMQMDGSGDRVTFADSADWDLGSGDATIEVEVVLNNISGDNMFCGRVTNASTSYFYFGLEGTTLRFRDYHASASVVDVTATVTISVGVRYRFAISKNGTSYRLFQDGVQVGTTTVDADALTDRAVELEIGSMTAAPSYVMNGYIRQFRWSKGLGRYTANYTPSADDFDPDTAVELVTPFALAYLPNIKYTQNADTMYITTGTYKVQKHQRTSSTVFTIADTAFARGPFLDTNITSTTITASSATGATTLTASASIFQSGHVGSLWRVKDGVVKITSYSSGTSVGGTVQAEPDGTAGNLGSTAAQTDWAEGSWSGVRGYPKCCTFHEGRLCFAATTYQPGGIWESVPFEYQNFDARNGDDDGAINRELNADTVVEIRWIVSTPKGLQCGTTGGVFNFGSGSQGLPITPDNSAASQAVPDGTADIQGRKMGNYVYFATNDLQKFLESGYQFDVDQVDTIDTTLLADHILNAPIPTNIPYRLDSELGGAYDLDVQQSPNNRMWIVRDDGQMAVLVRNPRQEVNGWSRIIGGETLSCDGKSGTGVFESIVIIKQEGQADIIWIQANYLIDGAVTRFILYFTPENFKYPWDAVRLDCSLTLDEPVDISAVYLLNPVLVLATAHGLANGDRIRLDNIVGTHQLNGQEYLVSSVTTNSFRLEEAT